MSTKYWDKLLDEDKDSVLLHSNAGFGIVLNPSESWGVSYGTKLVDMNKDQFSAIYPPKSGKYHTEILETEAEFNLRNFGLNKVSANAGLSGTIEGITGGAKGSMSSSEEEEHSSSTKKTTYYLYAEYAVKMVTLNLKTDPPGLDPTFEKELKKVLEGRSQGVQKLTSVYRVLNKKGWYVPTSLTLGGKLIQTETVQTKKTTRKDRIRREFTASFEASVGVPEVFDANAGGSTENTSEHESSSSLYESKTGKVRDVVGGSPQGLRQDGLEAWLTSLENDAQEWKVIGMELQPTLSFVPDVLLNDLRKLHNEYGGYEAAQRHADIDIFKYFGEVELKSPDGLGGDDEWD